MVDSIMEVPQSDATWVVVKTIPSLEPCIILLLILGPYTVGSKVQGAPIQTPNGRGSPYTKRTPVLQKLRCNRCEKI